MVDPSRAHSEVLMLLIRHDSQYLVFVTKRCDQMGNSRTSSGQVARSGTLLLAKEALMNIPQNVQDLELVVDTLRTAGNINALDGYIDLFAGSVFGRGSDGGF